MHRCEFAKHLQTFALAFVAVAALITSRDVQAGPVVFRFTSEVEQIVGDQALLPFNVELGDLIEADVIVDSGIFDLGVQRANVDAVFSISDVKLTTSHTALASGFAAGEPPIPVPNSAIFLECDSPTDALGCIAGSVPEASSVGWAPSLTIVGSDGLIDDIGDLLQQDVWTEFNSYRGLQLSFFDTNDSRVEAFLTLDATVGPVVIVPEACSEVLLSVAMGNVGVFLYSRAFAH